MEEADGSEKVTKGYKGDILAFSDCNRKLSFPKTNSL